nr:hypothetical protein BaRGS_021414 [Batillaria attramentaria]
MVPVEEVVVEVEVEVEVVVEVVVMVVVEEEMVMVVVEFFDGREVDSNWLKADDPETRLRTRQIKLRING